MDEMGLVRCGIVLSGAADAPSASDSIVALLLRFLGDGAPCGVVAES